MITIIFGEPRKGKTCLLTHIANTMAFDYQRSRLMRNEIQRKIESGFTALKTVPAHCVSANYDITLKKFGCSPRFSRRINPYKLGFSNPFVDVHFNLPYEAIFITEAQKYLNSRLSKNFPDWQSRWYEQHGHNNLDIWLDTQRPMLIDVNVRDLSKFIEIINLDIEYDCFGKPCRLTWQIRRIDNSSLFDKYMASGKSDKSCYTEDVIVADYNVFACYDSQCCKPKFYAGHLDQDFDYEQARTTEDSYEGYVKFLKEFDDELPESYFTSKTDDKKKGTSGLSSPASAA